MGKLLTVLGISEELQGRLPKGYLMRETFLEGLQKVYANASDSPRRNQLAYTISSSIRDLLADIKELETGVPQPKPKQMPQPTPEPTPPQKQPTPPTPPQTPPTPPPTPSQKQPTPPPPSKTPEEKIPLKKFFYNYINYSDDLTVHGNTWKKLQDNFSSTFNITNFKTLILSLEWKDGLNVDLYLDATDTEFLEELNAYPDLPEFIYNNWELLQENVDRNKYSFNDTEKKEEKDSPKPTPEPPQPKNEKKSEPIKLKAFKLLIENKDGGSDIKRGKKWIELSRRFIDKFDKELFASVYFELVWEDNFGITSRIYSSDKDKDAIEDLDNLIHFGSWVYKYWDKIIRDDKRDKNDYDFTGKPASNIPPPIPSSSQKEKSNNVPAPEPPKKRGRPKKSPESKQPEQKTKGKKDIDDIFDIDINDIEV